MDTLLYVWDQYMIGLDTPGFDSEWLAVATTVMLGLLKEKMKDCNSVSFKSRQKWKIAMIM